MILFSKDICLGQASTLNQEFKKILLITIVKIYLYRPESCKVRMLTSTDSKELYLNPGILGTLNPME